MRSRLEIVAVPDGGGGTRMARLRSGPPLTARQTLDGVTLVASAGGPLGGDTVEIDVQVAAGAELIVGSAAATVVQPSRTGGEALLVLDVEAGDGARVVWRPRPTVVARGAAYRAETTVRLARAAVLVLTEVTVLGRHAEAGGTATLRLDVEREGRPVLRTETAWGPAGWPGAAGPAVLGDARVVGTALVVGWGVAEEPPGPGAEVLRLADDAAVVTALGADTLQVERALAAVVGPVVAARRAAVPREAALVD